MDITEDMYDVLVCGCWQWKGSVNQQGYARLGSKIVHRVWWSKREGPLEPGWQVDHLCFNTLCVNPSHHEAVPAKVNNLRRRIRNRLMPWASHCVRGHEMDDLNTIWRANGTGRQCRYCQALRAKEWALRTHGSAITPNKPWTTNGTLKNKHLYEVTPQMLGDAGVGDKWLAMLKTCNHSNGSSVGISLGKVKNVSEVIDKDALEYLVA